MSNVTLGGIIGTIVLVATIAMYSIWSYNQTYSSLLDLYQTNLGQQINYLTNYKDIYSYMVTMANDFNYKIYTYKSIEDLKSLWLNNLGKYKQNKYFLIIIDPALDNGTDVTDIFKNKDWDTIYTDYPAKDIRIYTLGFYGTFYNLIRVY